MPSSLAYHEPSVVDLVILSSFLLLLNAVNFTLDRLLYCGLIGQVLVGMAWGLPGAGWLAPEVEAAVMQLGYIGLILIVFEGTYKALPSTCSSQTTFPDTDSDLYQGGLSTSIVSLKANLVLSASVAITGIAVPIGFSFFLRFLVDASPVQAFAAGAALCSTSLGTTFTVLGTSGLSSTRLGVVLTSAAMMDDVVGLVMVQVVSNLGSGDFSISTVVRPLLVSLAFAVVVPLACHFIIRPVTSRLNLAMENNPDGRITRTLGSDHASFALQTVWLFCLVVAGMAAGASNLLAAYLAGATISWWYSEVPHGQSGKILSQPRTDQLREQPSGPRSDAQVEPPQELQSSAAAPSLQLPEAESGLQMYHTYYSATVSNVLKPFFFASIGFSIPVTKMFSGPIVWRGFIYTLLMIAGKLCCGIWLLSYASPLRTVQRVVKKLSSLSMRRPKTIAPGGQCVGTGQTSPAASPAPQEEKLDKGRTDGSGGPNSQNPPQAVQPAASADYAAADMPVSVYPACILALSMVARGEIGYLISAVAESSGMFGRESRGVDEPSDLFLVVTWAITLCTIIGPVSVGLLVRRVKKLESRSGRGPQEGRRKVLGIWGVS
ncbi:sodium/hydrogen exchanger family protein [Thozetella sp. PMI_491]|nr:sodium/hydrogen exchanger family protein [Thozetella sp. PMI_491]